MAKTRKKVFHRPHFKIYARQRHYLTLKGSCPQKLLEVYLQSDLGMSVQEDKVRRVGHFIYLIKRLKRDELNMPYIS